MLAQQVFGGSGYIKDTGIEQLVRDARIAQIYEGTNGIQALDLLQRKVMADDASALHDWLQWIGDQVKSGQQHPVMTTYANALNAVITTTKTITTALIRHRDTYTDLTGMSAVASDYLHLLGHLSVGAMWLMTLQTVIEKVDNASTVYQNKHATAHFFFIRLLPQAHAMASSIEQAIDSNHDSVFQMTW